MTDALTPHSPTSADTWPPPPASAPQTFTIEKMIVTFNGDHLQVKDASTRSFWIMITVVQSVLGTVFQMAGVYASLLHLKFNPSRPLSHFWQYPYQSLAHYLIFHAFLLLFMFALIARSTWEGYCRSGQGVTLFSRLTRSACRGRMMGLIVSLGVPHSWRDGAPVAKWYQQPYVVRGLLDSNSKSNFKGVLPCFTFLGRENVVRFGQLLADFLKVPVVKV